MKNLNLIYLFTAITLFLTFSCSTTDSTTSITNNPYLGTGSVSQGIANTTNTNLFPSGTRVAGLGIIVSTDSKTWTVPADVNFTNTTFPFASDLYNSYVSGHSYSTSATAVSALSASNVVTIDNDGEIYTAYVFGDNYFEMYVNGVAVGKDPVPFTDFNSCIIQFKVNKPFTIAVKCVDWEEKLGLGTETQGSTSYKIGDGGFVAVIKNASNQIETTTNSSWKAQTFYIAPISDLGCLSETGNYRYSSSCSTSLGASNSYGIHWAIPSGWFTETYDDSNWPSATTFSNSTVGIDNKPSYNNFVDIFDDANNNAGFIWSTNLLLDNEILLRKTVN